MYTVCLRSLQDTINKKYINFLIRKGVWELIFEFEGTLRGSRWELFCDFESPRCCLLLLLLLCRLPIGLMGRTTAMSVCTCASINQKSNLFLPTCHLHSL